MDQYFVVKLLGQGAEGHVLQCQNKKTNELLAIKRMEISNMERANLHMNEATSIMLLTSKKSPEENNLVEYKRVFLHRYPAVCLIFVSRHPLSEKVKYD
jgi:dual specificity protein kinase YAK1